MTSGGRTTRNPSGLAEVEAVEGFVDEECGLGREESDGEERAFHCGDVLPATGPV